MNSKIFYRIANKNGYGPYCIEYCPKTYEYLDNEGFTLNSSERPILKTDEIKFKNADEAFLFDWLFEESDDLIYCFKDLGQLLDWFDARTLNFFEYFGEVFVYKFEMEYPNYFIDTKQCVVRKREYLKAKRYVISYSEIFKPVEISKSSYPSILLNKFIQYDTL